MVLIFYLFQSILNLDSRQLWTRFRLSAFV